MTNLQMEATQRAEILQTTTTRVIVEDGRCWTFDSDQHWTLTAARSEQNIYYKTEFQLIPLNFDIY